MLAIPLQLLSFATYLVYCPHNLVVLTLPGEAESILVPVRDDDAGTPFDTLVKNIAHDTKLKRWKHMDDEEKAASKLADVLEQVSLTRLVRRAD